MGEGPRSGDPPQFFKQVQADMAQIPADFLDYLRGMIHPGHLDDARTVISLDPSSFNWGKLADSSLHGAILLGWSTPDPPNWLEEVWRVLKPGAHLMLISPEDQPTGHTGACHVEDRGFEIRDAILLAQEPGSLHYVPKANRTERNAGTAHLARGVTGGFLWFPKTEDEEELAELQKQIPDYDLSVGIEKTQIPEDLQDVFVEGRKRGNIHPTAKPIEIMRQLLEGVPQETVVLDPFLGSGATVLACLQTGHDCVGIEKDESYLKIADARTRHWNRETRPWDQAELESDVDSRPKKKSVSMDELLGLK